MRILKLVLQLLLVPLLVFLGSRAVVQYAPNHPYTPSQWARWDSGHYVRIIDHGYAAADCRVRRPGGPVVCGHSRGWFPGYPYFSRYVAKLFDLQDDMAAFIVPAVSTFLIFLALWISVCGQRLTTNSVVTLLAAAFFPGHIYYHALFPISMTLLFVLLMFLAFKSERWFAGGLSGAVATFCYPTSLFLVPATGLWHLVHLRQVGFKKTFWRLLSSSFVMLGGIAAFCLLLHVSVGEWDGFFKVQAKYGHGIHNPLPILWHKLEPLFEVESWSRQTTTAVQTATVLFFLVSVTLAVALRRSREKSVAAFELLVLIFLWSFTLLPLIAGPRVTYNRAEAMLLPGVLLFTRLPRPHQFVLLAIFIALSYPISGMFFGGFLR